MKFSSQQIQKIEELKHAVKESSLQIDKRFNTLCRNMNLDSDTKDWLFDYVYNDFGSIEMVEKHGSVPM